jgi:hypothetical protein
MIGNRERRDVSVLDKGDVTSPLSGDTPANGFKDLYDLATI